MPTPTGRGREGAIPSQPHLARVLQERILLPVDGRNEAIRKLQAAVRSALFGVCAARSRRSAADTRARFRRLEMLRPSAQPAPEGPM
jgi:hypothetical protein